MSQWLFLTKEPTESNRTLLISIPRHVVRLSTRRSRIRRLIRETVRLEKLARPGKILHFVVRRPAPSQTKLQNVRGIIQDLIKKEK